MSEEINTPAIPALSVMLPLPILLTYCMANMGEFVIDKEAKTFTLSEPYVYSLDQLNDWEDLINQQILIYKEQLEPDEDIRQNDYEIFHDVLEFIKITKQLVQ